MNSIYKTVNQYLENGESVVLTCIVDHAGSTPREIGSKMIVQKNKQTVGSIGGGILEKMVQDLAARVFDSGQSAIKSFSLNKEEVANIGMTCGGDVVVYLSYIDVADSKTREVFKKAALFCDRNEAAWMITTMSDKDGCFEIYVDGEAQADIADFDALKGNFDYKSHYIIAQNVKYMIDPVTTHSKAYIFGGGHIGCELVHVLNRLGFYTVVIDDRGEFANNERFPLADACMAQDFGGAFETLHIDNTGYIIIVTRGHMHDQEVLADALRTKAAYIGMIGSRTKRNLIYQNLLAQGYSQDDIRRVHSPIGLSIGAHTPEEIAISIAAELIQERANG